MFLDYYGLREQPFGVTPNPRYLYHSRVHREALASLIYGIESDIGFAALIAEPGMGKTTLLFYLLEKFRFIARTALVFQTQCTSVELLRYLLNELEAPCASTDPVVLHEELKRLLITEARAGRKTLIIVDEAQNLDPSVLETIRLLSDFETPETKLLHIILAGQPELAEKLARPGMAQLLQRIAMLNRLARLSRDEVAEYINYRLSVAGYRGRALFTAHALDLISELSGGIPRKINRVAFNALSIGCALQTHEIDTPIIEEVGADLDVRTAYLHPPGASTVTEPPTQEPEQRPAAPQTTGAKSRIIASRGPMASPRIMSTAPPLMAGASQQRTSLATALKVVPSSEPQPGPIPIPKPAPTQPLSRKTSSAHESSTTGRRRRGTLFSVLLVPGLALTGFGAWQIGQKQHSVPQVTERSTTVAEPAELDSVEIPPLPPKAEQGGNAKTGRAQSQRRRAEGRTSAGNSRSESAGAGIVDSGGSSFADRDITPAELVLQVDPLYPSAAQQAGIQGRVVVHTVIDKDGYPRDIRAVSGHPLLAQAAVEAVRQWKYRPYMKNGTPIEGDTQVIVRFDLPSRNR